MAKPLKKINNSAMILDPGEESAGVLRALIEKMGIEVVGWNKTGAQWMKLYSQFRPRFLFVDLLLPKRDGIYCINKLVAQDSSAICILLHPYTGSYANFIENRGLKAGAVAIIQRPINPVRLETMMKRYLE